MNVSYVVKLLDCSQDSLKGKNNKFVMFLRVTFVGLAELLQYMCQIVRVSLHRNQSELFGVDYIPSKY